MTELLKEQLESYFKDIQVSIPGNDRIVINTGNGQVLAMLDFFQKKGYNHLALISCVDWIDDHELELVYIIGSYGQGGDEQKGKERVTITLKTRIPRKDPKCVTIISVFENAEPYEREIHELFGIHFEGHPRLIPLLLEREYEIPPFRKDFDTREYVKQVFDTIPLVKEKKK
jgi:NADH-quinone oxidoreductase subunit C